MQHLIETQLCLLQDSDSAQLELVKKDEDEVNVFPDLPGSHIKQTFPALEFVKAICKVLSLDSALSSEVRRLRRIQN